MITEVGATVHAWVAPDIPVQYWSLQVGCAVRAAGGLDRDLRGAMRAGLGGGLGRRRCLLHAVHGLDNQEDHQGDDHKIDDGVQEDSIVDGGAPAACATASEGYGCPSSEMNRSEKLTPPSSRPIGGMMMSLTNEDIILPNAPPMMTPTARSTTLPRQREFFEFLKHLHPPQ